MCAGVLLYVQRAAPWSPVLDRSLSGCSSIATVHGRMGSRVVLKAHGAAACWTGCATAYHEACMPGSEYE